MYINVNILQSKGISLRELCLMQLCKQQKFEDLSAFLRDYFSEKEVEDLLSKGYIELIKGNKSLDWWEKLRASKQGQEFLENVSTMEVSNGDLQMRDYLIQMYLSHEDKERVVGNKKKIAIYIATLRSHLGLTLHEFFYLCELFLSEHVFTKNLEYLFFNSNKNRYGKFKDNLEDSPLYQFYETRKTDVENYWKRKIKNGN